MAATNQKKGKLGEDPYYPMVGLYFTVKFDGISNSVDSKFKEVSGITMEIENGLTVKEGGENGSVHELPGRATYSDLVLKRGYLKADTDLSRWCMSFFSNDYSTPLKTKDVNVQLLDDGGKPVFTWQFKGAYPKKMEISGFNSRASGDSAILVETITLKYENFKIL